MEVNDTGEFRVRWNGLRDVVRALHAHRTRLVDSSARVVVASVARASGFENEVDAFADFAGDAKTSRGTAGEGSVRGIIRARRTDDEVDKSRPRARHGFDSRLEHPRTESGEPISYTSLTYRIRRCAG